MEDSSALGAGERAGIARWWRVREGKVWTSVQWSEYEPRRSTTDLDKVAEDSVDLGGVCDDGENSHAVSTARTGEAGPCGGGAPGVILDIRRCGGPPKGWIVCAMSTPLAADGVCTFGWEVLWKLGDEVRYREELEASLRSEIKRSFPWTDSNSCWRKIVRA
jgi:hypothetical protein